MTFKHTQEKLKRNEVSYNEILAESSRLLEEKNVDFNFEVNRLPVDGDVDPSAPLYGLMLGVKNSYAIEDQPLTVGSEILKSFIPGYTATSIKNLIKAGATPITSLALDEFCMGGSGVYSATGIVRNPWQRKRITGGSSSGSAAAVASGTVHVATGTDTGDSIRRPAALTGTVGYKPSYGLISRYGISEYIPSLDTAGTIARSVDDAAIVAHYMMGEDDKDFSQSTQEISLLSLSSSIKDKSIAVIQEAYDTITDEKVKETFDNVIRIARESGASVEFVNFNPNLLKYLLTIYYTLSFSMSTSSLARIDSVNYGQRWNDDSYNKMIMNSKTIHTSDYIKKRFILGSYFLNTQNMESVFNKSKRIRMLIKQEFDRVLSDYDAYILPTTTEIAPLISETTEKFSRSEISCENTLLIPNFLGLPSISIPMGFKDGMPLGVCISGNQHADRNVLEIAKSLEDSLGLKGLKAGDSYE